MPDEAQLLAGWVDDPLAFISHFWPAMRVYDKQAEIIESVHDNVETYCHAAHETGKTRAAALIVLWFFCTRFPARVVTSSSSNTQLAGILWAEIGQLVRSAKYDLGVHLQTLKMQVMDPERNRPYEEHYVVGLVTNTVENFQGHHLPATEALPRVLFIFDEASAVPDEYYDAAVSQAQRLLAVSNPLSASGWYYRHCKAGDVPHPYNVGQFSRKVLHISGDDSPNVKIGRWWAEQGRTGSPPREIPGVMTWERYKHYELTLDPIKKAMRLHGQFYEGREYLMFPPAWLDAAEELWQTVIGLDRGPYFMGVDVAEGGRDLTCWAVIDRFGIVDVEAMSTRDTSVIPDITRDKMRRYKIPAKHVCFDRGAGGKQYSDLMKRQGLRVRAIGFGEGAREPKVYLNRRCEMYGRMRETMNPQRWTKVVDEQGNETWSRCFAIPPDSYELRGELTVLPLAYDERGKLWLPPKKKTKNSKAQTLEEMIGRSPDRADAVVLANWAMVAPVKPPPPRIDRPIVMGDSPIAVSQEGQGKEVSPLVKRIFGEQGGDKPRPSPRGPEWEL